MTELSVATGDTERDSARTRMCGGGKERRCGRPGVRPAEKKCGVRQPHGMTTMTWRATTRGHCGGAPLAQASWRDRARLRQGLPEAATHTPRECCTWSTFCASS